MDLPRKAFDYPVGWIHALYRARVRVMFSQKAGRKRKVKGDGNGGGREGLSEGNNERPNTQIPNAIQISIIEQ
jgi:hypothetical protein